MTNTDDIRSPKEQNRNKGPSSAGALPAVPSGQEHEAKTGARLARIRELNDQLRTTGRGGMVVLTNGIGGLGLPAVNRIFAAVAHFSDFSPDNDPWGEHDCASLEVDG